MAYVFQKHYTRDEARALLPAIRTWLGSLDHLRGEHEKFERRLTGLMAPGCDLGGSIVNAWARSKVEMDRVVFQFIKRDIQIKDPDRGLIDFPALIGGREVFLCWEKDEDDVEFWHDLDAGYAGRERL